MFVSRIIRERKKERDKIVIFSSSFYCLYFIFQFENKKSLEGKEKDLSKYYTNVSYLHVGKNIFIRRKTISFSTTGRRRRISFKEVKTWRQLRKNLLVYLFYHLNTSSCLKYSLPILDEYGNWPKRLHKKNAYTAISRCLVNICKSQPHSY